MHPTLLLSVLAVLATATPVQDQPAIKVCGANFQTYATPAAAYAAGTKVVHCGACAACSNAPDVAIHRQILQPNYDPFAKFLTCHSGEFESAFGNAADAAKCVALLKFSDRCGACWKDNFACVYKNCKSECTAVNTATDVPNNEHPCMTCATTKCTPAMNACQGAHGGSLIEAVDVKQAEAMCAKTA
jgi:hypothetical protein